MKGKICFDVLFSLLLAVLFLISGACGSIGLNGEEVPTRGENEEESGLGTREQALSGSCPEPGEMMYLWFSHFSLLDQDFGGGETFHLEFENQPPSYFLLSFNQTGDILEPESQYINQIRYQGTATHPNNRDCPIQTFDGVWELTAELSGTCQDGQVDLHIEELWLEPQLKSSCGQLDPVPGITSAPELDLRFDLSEAGPRDGLIVGTRDSVFYANYSYQLSPSDSLEIVPLVPDQ